MQTETIARGITEKVTARSTERGETLSEVAAAAHLSTEALADPAELTVRQLVRLAIVLDTTPMDILTAETVTE